MKLLSPALFDDFCQKSRAMYEKGRKSSPLDKLLVYSCMTNICSEFSGIDDGQSAIHHHNLARTFSALLLQALSTFPLLTSASMNTVETLLTAVRYDSVF